MLNESVACSGAFYFLTFAAALAIAFGAASSLFLVEGALQVVKLALGGG